MTVLTAADLTTFNWATVTGISPLQIRLDGDTTPLALIPDSLVDPTEMVVGQRVRVELATRKCVVHGVANAASLQRDTGWITITNTLGTVYYRRLNGVTYLRGRTTPTATGQTQFTLPAGFRPIDDFSVQADRGGTPVRAVIYATGAVQYSSGGGSANILWASVPPFPADL